MCIFSSGLFAWTECIVPVHDLSIPAKVLLIGSNVPYLIMSYMWVEYNVWASFMLMAVFVISVMYHTEQWSSGANATCTKRLLMADMTMSAIAGLFFLALMDGQVYPDQILLAAVSIPLLLTGDPCKYSWRHSLWHVTTALMVYRYWDEHSRIRRGIHPKRSTCIEWLEHLIGQHSHASGTAT